MTLSANAETDRLVQEMKHPLQRYVHRIVRCDEDATDIAQEAFLRLHTCGQTQSITNSRAFLYRTANNLAVDYLRRAHVRDRYLRSEISSGMTEPSEAVPSAERSAAACQELDQVMAAISSLAPQVKRAFLLHRGTDASYADIAEEMGVSCSMVEKYIVQALKTLREQLVA